MARMHTLFRSSVLVTALIIASAGRAKAEDLNDYPTSARADYGLQSGELPQCWLREHYFWSPSDARFFTLIETGCFREDA
jgi:hypothetical protein